MHDVLPSCVSDRGYRAISVAVTRVNTRREKLFQRLRKTVLSLLRKLPTARLATDEEGQFCIERYGLMGRGIGYIDAHLLPAMSLIGTRRLWTKDKRLGMVAESMRWTFEPV